MGKASLDRAHDRVDRGWVWADCDSCAAHANADQGGRGNSGAGTYPGTAHTYPDTAHIYPDTAHTYPDTAHTYARPTHAYPAHTDRHTPH